MLQRINNFFGQVVIYKNIIIAAAFGVLLLILRNRNDKIAELKLNAEQASHEAIIAQKQKELDNAKQKFDTANGNFNAWLAANKRQ